MTEFLKILVAWIFFCWGAMLLVVEIYTYIETSGENTLWSGDYFAMIRWLLFSGSFALWYWLLFV
jgi:hypothetical protein